jgi:hypothetical protein
MLVNKYVSSLFSIEPKLYKFPAPKLLGTSLGRTDAQLAKEGRKERIYTHPRT